MLKIFIKFKLLDTTLSINAFGRFKIISISEMCKYVCIDVMISCKCEHEKQVFKFFFHFHFYVNQFVFSILVIILHNRLSILLVFKKKKKISDIHVREPMVLS